MLDINLIRENPEIVKDNLRKRGDLEKLKLVDELLTLDKKRKKLITEINNLRHLRNKISHEINLLKKEGKSIEEKIKEAKEIPVKIKKLEEELGNVEAKITAYLYRLPNLLHESVPIGESEEDNVVVKTWGSKPKFDFKPRDHIDLALSLDLVDIERAAKVSGARFYYLKKDLVQLNYALIKFALDMMEEKGFILFQPPYMVRRKVIESATDLADFEDVIYKIEEEDLYLIPTSEHALLGLHMNEILSSDELPLRYSAISPCFRKEAGTHGRDTKGIFRVHQFEKVEQFIFCKPEESWKEHELLLANAEEIFQKLRIPYRVVNVCTGDIGTVAAKKYDIEAWLPGQGKYREVVSCSNCTDYQARRAKIRYRAKPNEPTKFVHTLNSTLLATERALIAIMENYQQEDGSIKIPEVLVKYMNGKREIA